MALHQDALVIGAKLDADANGESCRLAFYGRLVWLVDHTNQESMSKLRVYKVGMGSISEHRGLYAIWNAGS